MNQYFTTEFGNRIDFVPGYFKKNGAYLSYIEGKRLGFNHPAKDYVHWSATLYFLERNGLLKKWNRGIDIGGAEGTCIALTKGAGFLDYAVNVDILDYSGVVDETYFGDFLEFMSGIDTNTTDEAQDVQRAILAAKRSFDYFSYQPLMTGMFDKFKRAPTVDERRHASVFDVSDKFDLVTTYAAFEHFDLKKILTKVREILEPGGTFVAMDGYWWFPINSVGFIGHFPYAMQRLSPGDLERYVTQEHPEMWEGIKQRAAHMTGGDHRPTVTDWFSIAQECGLRPLAVERVMPRWHHRIAECPPTLFAQPYFNHEEVLRDIAYLRPGVVVDDLFTSAIRLAMTTL